MSDKLKNELKIVLPERARGRMFVVGMSKARGSKIYLNDVEIEYSDLSIEMGVNSITVAKIEIPLTALEILYKDMDSES